jgi:uncharacterized membrane protein
MRWLRHLFAPSAARRFPPARLERITAAIAAGEALHDGELVFAVEGGLPWAALAAGTSPRARAHAVFTRLHVWDTAANNGVLLYLLLADRAVEIVADRGLHGRIADTEWEEVCRAVEAASAAGEALDTAVVAAIERISILLARHCPATPGGRDELPDPPVLL